MRFLHTSDWHLGRTLYGRKRYIEFERFLEWLVDTLDQHQVDVLLVAGDVFDTNSPSNQAQKLYYQFLCRVATTGCSHVIVIGGNHDSPTFLNAPRELLQALNVHVIGSISERPEDELLEVSNSAGELALICAVPYLRDRDLRKLKPGQTADQKSMELVEGLRNHYQTVVQLAEKQRLKWLNQGKSSVPILGMGHLFTTGGKTVDGDGVRDLYVGSLAQMDKEVFPEALDYLALGHLHVPQKVGGCEHIRYCGSPIPMGFGEARQQKKVLLVDFRGPGTGPEVNAIDVPCFQRLIRIAGSLKEIEYRIEELVAENSSAWLEIEYTGEAIVSDLRETLEQAVSNSQLEIRRIQNRRVMQRVWDCMNQDEKTLDDLSVEDVFSECLKAHAVEGETKDELLYSFREILHELHSEEDL